MAEKEKGKLSEEKYKSEEEKIEEISCASLEELSGWKSSSGERNTVNYAKEIERKYEKPRRRNESLRKCLGSVLGEKGWWNLN